MTSAFQYLQPELPPGLLGYLVTHEMRFAFTLRLVRRHIQGTVLDIGPHIFTAILRHEFSSRIDTLGFKVPAYEELIRPRSGETHHEYDLHEACRPPWPRIGPYGTVIAAEVVEHLYVHPQYWLGFFDHLLVPGGKLILTTPNAANLKRRFTLLAGAHPFEMIGLDPKWGSHFREYTRSEVLSWAGKAGFKLEACYARSHMCPPGRLNRGLWAVSNLLPSSLRQGMYFVFAKPGA
jgi:hypothetical protein